jgi:hypothetical protein
MRSLFRRLPLLLVPTVLLLSGCLGSSEPSLPPLFPVKGTVKVDGQPVTSGQVSLVLLAGTEGAPAPASNGKIDSSGNYEIFTGGKSGAPAGKYKVTVTPTMVPADGATKMAAAPYSDSYRDPAKTTLVVEVSASSAADAFDLKLKK